MACDLTPVFLDLTDFLQRTLMDLDHQTASQETTFLYKGVYFRQTTGSTTASRRRYGGDIIQGLSIVPASSSQMGSQQNEVCGEPIFPEKVCQGTQYVWSPSNKYSCTSVPRPSWRHLTW